MQKPILALAIFVMIILNTAFAETEQASEPSQSSNQERAAYLDPELKKQLALAKTLKAHEIEWLEVSYPESSEPQKTLAIAHPSLIAEEQGAILLIHDKEQHADWPQIIRPLRQTLPESGWYTLSVSLPDDTRGKLPSRELAAKGFDQLTLSESLRANLDSGQRNRNEPAENASESAESTATQQESESAEAPAQDASDSEESVDIDLAAAKKQDKNKIPYDVRALSHIEKAVETIKSKSYQTIVMVAHRQSAELVLNYVKAHQSELTTPGFAIVFIEPLVGDAYLLNLKEWLGDSFSVPILEVLSRSNLEAVEKAKARELAMKKAGVGAFRQLFLTISNTEIFHESLSRRVKLWLEASVQESANSQ